MLLERKKHNILLFFILTPTIYSGTMNEQDTKWGEHLIEVRRKRKMYQVKKRDGKIADFNLSKIAAAITKVNPA